MCLACLQNTVVAFFQRGHLLGLVRLNLSVVDFFIIVLTDVQGTYRDDVCYISFERRHSIRIPRAAASKQLCLFCEALESVTSRLSFVVKLHAAGVISDRASMTLFCHFLGLAEVCFKRF